MNSRTGTNWLVAVVLTLGFVYLFLGIFQGLNYYDEGLALQAAARVAAGQLPYRDFWAYYAPGEFYTLAAVFRVFGSSILVERIWDTLVRFGICLVVFLTSRRLISTKAAYGSFLITLLFLGWLGLYGPPVFPALLWSLLAVLFLLHSFSREGYQFLLLGGLATGAAAVYRHDFGAFTFLSTAAALLLLALEDSLVAVKSRAKAVHRLKGLFVYTSATCAVVIPVLLYFLWTVPLHELRTDFLLFPRIQLRFRALPLPPLLPSPSYFINSALLLGPWFLFYSPAAVYLVNWIGLVRSVRAAPGDAARRGRRFGRTVLGVLGSLLFVQAYTRADFIHCFPTTIPAAILVPALLEDWPIEKRRTWSKRLVSFLLLVLAVPYVVVPVDWWRLHLQANAPWKVATSKLPRARYFRVLPDAEEAAQFIRQHAPQGQGIFVGNWQHRQLLYTDVTFYFLAERQAGTKFYDFIPGVTTTAPVQQAIISDLQRNRVEYIVLISDYGYDRTPTEVPTDGGVTLLDDFIRREYHQVQTFGHYSVWEKSPHWPERSR